MGGRARRRNRVTATEKLPRQKVSVPTDKRPRLPIKGAPDGRPTWRFGHRDEAGPWGWTWDGFHDHFDKLMDMEAKNWPEFTHTGTVGAKRIPLDHLCDQVQTRLLRLQFDDADALWELRVGGKPRLWGVRIENCFHFLWWDPQHTVSRSRRR
jgi:hypothetical protein